MQQPPNPSSQYQQQQGQQPPFQPQPYQQPPLQHQPNKIKKWTTIIVGVFTIIGVVVALLAWIHPFSPAPPHSGVQDALTEYCNAVLKGDYQTAYNFTSKEGKQLGNEKD